MRIFHSLLIAFISFTIVGTCLGQKKFERIYRADNTQILSSSLHAYGGGYIVLSVEINEDGERPFVHLMSLDDKGTISWSTRYEYSDDDVFVSRLGEVIAHEDGQISFSAYLQKDSLNRVITRVDDMGRVLWSVTTGEEDGRFIANHNRTNLIALPSNASLQTSSVLVNNVSMPLITAIDDQGNIMWGQQYRALTANGIALSMGIRDVKLAADSTLIVVGNSSNADHPLFVTRMDTLGNVLWSKSFSSDMSGERSQTAVSVVEMLDSSILVLAAEAGATTSGLLLHISGDGEYIESRELNATNPSYEIFPTGIAVLKDNSLAIGLRRLDISSGDVNPVVLRFSMDSTLYYETMLKSSTDIDLTNGGFISTDSTTALFLTSTTKLDSATLQPYLTKVDMNGTTDCSVPVDFISFDSTHFNSESLIWRSTDQTESGTMEVFESPFEYTPPILSLRDTSYCPDDPIMFTLDATTRGATSYIWEDGSTDSVRVVTKPGQYIVTVIVGVEECFTLCDTANVTQKMEPMISIVADDQEFCNDGSILLGINSSNPPVDITWSTGAKTPTIRITELKEYSVTIIDDCGLSASESLDLSGFKREINPSISVSSENLCTDGSLVLIAGGPGVDPANLIWYRGSVGGTQIAQGTDRVTIAAGETGDYSVENLESFCPGQASVTIIEDQFLTPVTVEVNGNCQNSNYVLTATTSGATTVQWEDQSTSPTRIVTQAGTYAVVATDICGNTTAGSIEVSQNDINRCNDNNPPADECTNNCLQWPNAFYPGSSVARNHTFGPEERECRGFLITDYTLSIYNRWGQKIYESTSPTDRWNGQKDNNGKAQPGDTYFYHAAYTIDGESCSREGDVLLIR